LDAKITPQGVTIASDFTPSRDVSTAFDSFGIGNRHHDCARQHRADAGILLWPVGSAIVVMPVSSFTEAE